MAIDQQGAERADADSVWKKSRPVADGYGIPETDDGMLDLDAVRDRLRQAQNYPTRIIAWTQFPADATRWTRQDGTHG